MKHKKVADVEKWEKGATMPSKGWKVQNEDIRAGLAGRGLPTFGTRDCALRHEERVNGSLHCLPLPANATSVSIAPQPDCNCRCCPCFKLGEKRSVSSGFIATDDIGTEIPVKRAVFPHSVRSLEKMKGRVRIWTLINVALPEVSGYNYTKSYSSSSSVCCSP